MWALGWPFRSPRWFRRILLMGLVNLVPVVGTMALLGWLLACLDNLRRGADELPPAGFGYMRRGWRPFVVMFLYWLALIVAYTAIAVTGDVLDIGLDWEASLVYFLGLFAITSLAPAIVLAADRGVRGGLNLPRILANVRRHLGPAAAAGALTLLLVVVAQAGVVALGMGLILTTAYSIPALAAVIRRYEVASA